MKNLKTVIVSVIASVVLIVALFVSFSLFEDADRSKNYVCQFPFTGKYEVWTEGGTQWQGMGNVHQYSKTSQIEFNNVEKSESGYVSGEVNPGANVTFNDNGRGYILGSMRVVLPNDEMNMKKIQTDFGSEEALLSNLVRPTLYKVIIACGPLMSSMESVSSKRTDLINYITDQLNNGVYKTVSHKVDTINSVTGEKETHYDVSLIKDPSAPGGYKRQEVSPFAQYGIKCGLVSLTDIKYDSATQEQIDAQKKANLAVITSKTRAVEATQKTIQIEEEGKAAAAKAKWDQEKEKALAVTKAEQEREVSRLAAEKAEFDKKRILAEGEAKAAANKALVAAGLTPSEKAEWDYKTAVGIAQALADSKQRWVPEVIMNGGNSSHNPMDAVGLNMMMDIVNKINKK